MPSKSSSTRKSVLVPDAVLNAFQRNADRQANICIFLLGAVAGCAYGAAVTFYVLVH